jgi:hypothetical protein
MDKWTDDLVEEDGTRCTNLFNDEFGAFGICNVSGLTDVIRAEVLAHLAGRFASLQLPNRRVEFQ